ncbi:MAG TPA: hypothetical protein VMF90_06025 [Rhizobiaceae bacterium]|nr:hypothetical protein [Rhizobiaceae bacterium]
MRFAVCIAALAIASPATAGYEDELPARIAKCWNLPPMVDQARIEMTIRIDSVGLFDEGEIHSITPATKAMADSVMRAVQNCGPYPSAPGVFTVILEFPRPAAKPKWTLPPLNGN